MSILRKSIWRLYAGRSLVQRSYVMQFMDAFHLVTQVDTNIILSFL